MNSACFFYSDNNLFNIHCDLIYYYYFVINKTGIYYLQTSLANKSIIIMMLYVFKYQNKAIGEGVGRFRLQ